MGDFTEAIKRYLGWFPSNPLGFCIAHLLLTWTIVEIIKSIREIQ